MTIMELKGLKGLQAVDALLSDTVEPRQAMRIQQLNTTALTPGQFQPRLSIENHALEELAASIQSQGILQPLLVRAITQGGYEIIAGERRWRAAQLAGLKTVPAIVRDVSDETALAFALIENIQRASLNPIEEALALARLQSDFHLTHDEMAKRVGRSRSAVSNLLRLLNLNDEVKMALITNKIEMGHARALLSLDDRQQKKLSSEIIAGMLSVRETEKKVQQLSKLHQPSQVSPKKPDLSIFEKMLSQLLATQVKIELNQQGKGKIIIPIAKIEAIQHLIQHLKRSDDD